MKKIIFALFTFTTLSLSAQVKPKKEKLWKKTAEMSMNFSQASFSNNWQGGGTNNIALLATANMTASYKKGKTSWGNKANMQYGILKNKGEEMRKSNDILFLDTKYGHQLSSKWNAFAAINFLSQFDNGYKFTKDYHDATIRTKISAFMSPAYLIESFGIEYKPKPYFDARLGLGSTKQTFVLDQSLYNATDTIKYGVPVGKKVINEFGFQLLANFDKNIYKDIVNLKVRYVGFFDYDKLIKPDRWSQRVDIILTAKISKYINVTFNSVLLYDHFQHRSWQTSQIFGLGISYKK
ncbi:MAG: DUF3078 domain-containing protein [Bacteroidota bacterium]|nr:DUF3078 domain-containing protein [Bacteroidota bacterium]